MTRPELKHFKPSEFGKWWPLMSAELLEKLDLFRERWGAPVRVSPAEGGIGRHDDSHSQHNVNLWGEVRAIDVFPEGMNDPESRARAYQIAIDVGFTGVGLYTDTRPSDMLHVDVRQNREEGQPATWSRVDHEYKGITEVIA